MEIYFLLFFIITVSIIVIYSETNYEKKMFVSTNSSYITLNAISKTIKSINLFYLLFSLFGDKFIEI